MTVEKTKSKKIVAPEITPDNINDVLENSSEVIEAPVKEKVSNKSKKSKAEVVKEALEPMEATVNTSRLSLGWMTNGGLVKITYTIPHKAAKFIPELLKGRQVEVSYDREPSELKLKDVFETIIYHGIKFVIPKDTNVVLPAAVVQVRKDGQQTARLARRWEIAGDVNKQTALN